MGIINVLDESVANLIAAGEVVERPASVIKELVENSLDAKAKNITIEIKNGGISYMRVTDDGCGIEADDVGVAFLRHATSKIKDKEDLYKIGTLGFRGEALCSVAAVSNVVLTTKTADAPFATRVVVEGGYMEDVLNTGASKGTTVEVRKLFYNTPARMKFLKKDSTEAGYVADVVEKFILANPDVSFKFINSGKQMLFSPGDGKSVTAIYSVYGKDYANNVIEVDYASENMRVTGYIGKSNVSRPNRAYESFFVNKRSIKSVIMTKALEEAYKNQLMGGKFPFAVLDLQVNTKAVDVNVHPHKTEVKFSDEKRVFDTVYWGVKNALYKKIVIPDASFDKSKNKNPFLYKETVTPVKTQEKNDKKPIANPFFMEKREKREKSSETENAAFISEVLKPIQEMREEIKENTAAKEKRDVNVTFEAYSLRQSDDEEAVSANAERAFSEPPAVKNEPKTKPENLFFGKENVFEEKTQNIPESNDNLSGISDLQNTAEEKNDETKNEITPEENNFKICGAVFNTYIIVEQDDNMLMIDQHAAHERIKFEQLKKNLEGQENAGQQLLCGQIAELTAEEYDFALQNKEMFLKIGFDFEEMGYKKVMINAVPLPVCDEDPSDLFIGVLEGTMENKRQIINSDYERLLYTVACKSAVKANKALSMAEMEELVSKVFAMNNINTCPHGRPIIISFSKREIEKQFKRII